MTQINITEFRNNIKKYSDLAQVEDLEIVNRDKVLFIVKGPKSNRRESLEALIGSAKSNEDYSDILGNKIKEL